MTCALIQRFRLYSNIPRKNNLQVPAHDRRMKLQPYILSVSYYVKSTGVHTYGHEKSCMERFFPDLNLSMVFPNLDPSMKCIFYRFSCVSTIFVLLSTIMYYCHGHGLIGDRDLARPWALPL